MATPPTRPKWICSVCKEAGAPSAFNAGLCTRCAALERRRNAKTANNPLLVAMAIALVALTIGLLWSLSAQPNRPIPTPGTLPPVPTKSRPIAKPDKSILVDKTKSQLTKSDIRVEQPQPAEPAKQPTALSAKEIFDRVNRSVVTIEARGDKDESLVSGTGFVIDKSGAIVTNAHVVAIAGAKHLLVKSADGAERIVVKVSDIDMDRDLALFKTNVAIAPALELRDDNPHVGEKTFAIGHPLGLDRSFSEGIVSGIRTVPERQMTYIQTTAAISSGNSGGPLVDDAGRVIGVITSNNPKGQALNFAVSASDVRRFLERGGSDRPISELQEFKQRHSSDDSGMLITNYDQSLKGLQVFKLFLSDFHPKERKAGLITENCKKLIRDWANVQGVPIVDDGATTDSKRLAMLSVRIEVIPTYDKNLSAYVILLEVVECLPLPSSSDNKVQLSPATTWNILTHGSSDSSRLAAEIRDKMKVCFKSFADAYLSENRQ